MKTRNVSEGENYQMNLTQARKTIRDNSSGLVKWYVAAAILAANDKATVDDLMQCLKRGGSVAIRGAGGLYRRTKRKKSRGKWITDYNDWKRYISKLGLIRPSTPH